MPKSSIVYVNTIADSEEAEHFEADIVSTRISSLLQTESFVFAPPMLRQIHRHLFDGVFKNDWVGQWRQVNLTKKEPVLRGDSVSYAPFHLIGEMLDYDFGQRKRTTGQVSPNRQA